MTSSIIKPITLVRFGLGFVFLANSLSAFLAPDEFIDLISKSSVVNLIPISLAAFVLFIGINDFLVALLLFSGLGGKWIYWWALLWIIGVFIVKAAPLEILEESGFLFMTFALIINNKK